MADPLLAVTGLSKKYCRSLSRDLRYGVADVAAELLPGRRHQRQLRRDEFWVLDDISFVLDPGQALAVLGRNGAGKTTLLKLLYGLIKPDRGEIRLRGRVGAVIELGAGFNPVLTARENIEVGAALNGLHGAAARTLLDEVVAFAEIGTAIDAPVQSLSSGMRARLAMGLAACLSPDILLVDEALAVGDAAFQRKCVGRMREYLAGGGALIFVSHSAYQVQTVCDRGLLLHGGHIAFEGTAVAALNHMFENAEITAPGDGSRALVPGSPVSIDNVVIHGQGGGAIVSGEPAEVVLHYSSAVAMSVTWGFTITTGDQWICITGALSDATAIRCGAGELRCRIGRFPLLPGRYLLRTSIGDVGTLLPLARTGWFDSATVVEVKGRPDPLANRLLGINQLVTLETRWE